LHVLTAQVRKLSVRSFIVAVLSLDWGCDALVGYLGGR
jgi:hypothetical protein